MLVEQHLVPLAQSPMLVEQHLALLVQSPIVVHPLSHPLRVTKLDRVHIWVDEAEVAAGVGVEIAILVVVGP